ncbi:MAG: hypothetical protein Kow0062_19070 [Acidobacteriota bacterium]
MTGPEQAGAARASGCAPWVFGVVLLVALAAAGGCRGWKGTLPREGDLHPRLTPFTYLERGRLLALAADVRATIEREDDPFVPLAVGIANRGLDRLTLTRESFTLVDEQGRRYPLATIDEVREKMGNLVPIDLRISADFVSVFGSPWDLWQRVPATFFPVLSVGSVPGFGPRTIRRDRVELPRRSWMADLLYFPHPEGELAGRRFELWVDAEELDEPVFVKFAVRAMVRGRERP